MRARGSSIVVGTSGSSRPTRNGVGREHVSEIQRARILAAMVEESALRGVGGVTVAHVVACSGVSRRTFYEVFEDREDCFIAALDDGIARVVQAVVPAYRQGGRWRERIRSALLALLAFLDDEPALARMLIVDSLGAGPVALKRRSRVLGSVISAVEEGCAEVGGGIESAPLVAEGAVGAVLAVLHNELSEPRPSRLVSLLNPLMGIVVLPYLGRGAARDELKHPQPEIRPPRSNKHSDPLRELEMRLTYRTVRVLVAVGDNPGSSNRAVATGADISDQGQISKLLARLQGLGLVENVNDVTRGAPNAWTLTERGREVHGAISYETTGA
jgi:AcrR family transcriptional regulator